MNISSFLPRVTKYSRKNFRDSIQSHEITKVFYLESLELYGIHMILMAMGTQ